MDNQTVIISKHGTAISRWLQQQQKSGRHQDLSNLVIDNRARGSIDDNTNVIGTIPFDLAENCKQYYGIKFARRPNNVNGEMTAEQMQDSEAYLQPYVVFPVTKVFMEDVLEHHLQHLIEYVQANPTQVINTQDIVKLVMENITEQ